MKTDTWIGSMVWGRIGGAVLLIAAFILQGLGIEFSAESQQQAFGAVQTIMAATGGLLVMFSKLREKMKEKKVPANDQSGYMRIGAMFSISLATILAICIFGCGPMKSTAAIDPVQGPICDRPGFEDSWICAQLHLAGIPTAEDARDIILDANDVALIMEAYTIDQLARLLDKWDTILSDGGISYALYMSGLVKDTMKVTRISSILTRRFGPLLTSSAIIRISDLKLLKLLNQRIRESTGLPASS